MKWLDRKILRAVERMVADRPAPSIGLCPECLKTAESRNLNEWGARGWYGRVRINEYDISCDRCKRLYSLTMTPVERRKKERK